MRTPAEVMEKAFNHQPSKIFACYSGGNDSLVSTHWALENGWAHEVLHINTGIGVDEPNGLSVEEIVRETCKSYGWPLLVQSPQTSYRKLVLKFGFPGPGAHYLPYRLLKERCIRRVVKNHKIHTFDRIGLITGVHQQESARRMGYVEPIFRVGCQLWIAPLWNWSPVEFAA
ncbi:MAG: phosphoadenosine phosphosulfate reductase family protein, partial [Patescibacteria group bacterium]|nr:phosphoadenosine phosphosulfate reductase family protein [Patescibacteria group bacterium]